MMSLWIIQIVTGMVAGTVVDSFSLHDFRLVNVKMALSPDCGAYCNKKILMPHLATVVTDKVTAFHNTPLMYRQSNRNSHNINNV